MADETLKYNKIKFIVKVTKFRFDSYCEKSSVISRPQSVSLSASFTLYFYYE